eukprot:scaffold413986_cov24-Attheya_sp.AAC.1
MGLLVTPSVPPDPPRMPAMHQINFKWPDGGFRHIPRTNMFVEMFTCIKHITEIFNVRDIPPTNGPAIGLCKLLGVHKIVLCVLPHCRFELCARCKGFLGRSFHMNSVRT